MRTQGEHNTKVRFWISGPSSEKTESQTHHLKRTVLNDDRSYPKNKFRSFGKEAKKVDELLTLVQPNDQMRLLSILSIRKGKRLIQRILPHLNQESSIQILNCFINNLALITKVNILPLQLLIPRTTLNNCFLAWYWRRCPARVIRCFGKYIKCIRFGTSCWFGISKKI